MLAVVAHTKFGIGIGAIFNAMFPFLYVSHFLQCAAYVANLASEAYILMDVVEFLSVMRTKSAGCFFGIIHKINPSYKNHIQSHQPAGVALLPKLGAAPFVCISLP